MPVPEKKLLEHAAYLRRLVGGLVVDRHRVDDIVQETYLRALQQPPRHARHVRAWLATIARRLAFRLSRDALRRGRREQRAARPEGEPAASDVAARAEIHRRLAQWVEELDEPYRSAVVRRYLDGLLPREIAARDGIPVRTVQSRLHRGLATLRARLDRTYGDRAAWSLLLLPLGAPAVLPNTGGAVAKGAGFLTMKKIVAALIVLSALVLWIVSRGTRADPSDAATRADARGTEAASPETPGAAADPTGGDGPSPGSAERPEQPVFVFSGRVVDERGEGVAGAPVRLHYWVTPERDPFPQGGDRMLRRAWERVERPAATSDAEGRFRFERPWSSRSFVRVDADGFGSVVLGPFEPQEGLVVVLRRDSRLRVRVVDPDDRPVPDALVRLMPVSLSPHVSSRMPVAEGRTDGAGAIDLPRPDATGLVIEVAPREPELGFATAGLAKEASSVNVVVSRLETRTHRIVDARTGRPLPDAVAVVSWSGFQTRSWDQELRRREIRADANGVIRFPLQKDYYGHLVTAPGYDAQSLDRPVVALHRSATVEGVVLDVEGDPVPAAAVLIATEQGVTARGYANLPLVAAWSDDEGRYSVEIKLLWLPEGGDEPGLRSLVAVHPRHGCAVVDAVPVTSGARLERNLRFPRPARVDVELVGTDGEPRPGYWMNLRRRVPASKPLGDREQAFGINVPFLFGVRTVSDEDGRVALDRLPPGSYALDVKHRRVEFDLREGESRTERMVWGSGLSIAGRVLDEHGKPKAGVMVGLAGPNHHPATTDGEGRFRFEDIAEGAYSVGYYSPRADASVSADVRAGDTDVVLREPSELARLRIEVDGPEGGRGEYWYGTVNGSQFPKHGRGFWEFLPGENETPTFAPARGVLVVRAKDHAWAAVAFDARGGEPTVVRVALPRAGAVEGRVPARLLAGDGPFRVSLLRLDDDRKELCYGDARLEMALAMRLGDLQQHGDVEGGRAFVTNVAPGRYRAVLQRRVDRRWSATGAYVDVEVAPGGTASIAFAD